MKTAFTILLCLALIKTSSAQTFSEWFRQKKTQKKYLIEQIAALQVYAGYLEKGYLIVEEGLNQINSIKHGDFDLHLSHFNSLKNVNPHIKDNAALNDVSGLQLQIETIHKKVLQQVREPKTFDLAQRDYITAVFKKLLEGCQADENLYTLLITSDLLQMKDDERLAKMGGVYKDMQEKYEFATAFANQIYKVALSRSKEERGIETIKSAFDIKH